MDRALAISSLFDEYVKDSDAIYSITPLLFNGIISLISNDEAYRHKLCSNKKELHSLSRKLEDTKQEILYLENQVKTARKLLDEERSKRRIAEAEKFQTEQRLFRIYMTCQEKDIPLGDDINEEMNLLKARRSVDHLDTITEFESTGSVMSDLSYTRDEDELLHVSSSDSRPKKRRSGSLPPFSAKAKRKKSSTTKTHEIKPNERLVTTTTVTVEHRGAASVRSEMETVGPATPSCESDDYPYRPTAPPLTDSDENDPCKTPKIAGSSTKPFSMNLINTRPHTFINKAMIKAELCNVCCKRLRFSAVGAKCRDCKAICHVLCKEGVPVPCVPINTPTSKSSGGSIADYTPLYGLMVPSLIVHCIKEIESRGMKEVGLYRVPGSDKEVKSLKEKFLKGRGVPNLSNVSDIHVICGCMKDFLRSLREPLITQIRWTDFTRAADLREVEERHRRLHQIIAELPQPNRDTLAYIVLHLQRVAAVPDCKMPIANLAKMFGPSIVGLPKNCPDNALADTNQANKIMASILSLNRNFWEDLLKDCDMKSEGADLQKTPSTSSLLGYFSPNRAKPLLNMRYFETP